MINLQQDFLRQSIENLENLIGRLKLENDAGAFSEEFSRQAFRTLHTIKGTAQTFGFPVSGNLAHELETLLSTVKNGQINENDNCKTLFLEGLELLKKTFEQTDFRLPAMFFEKLRQIAPRAADDAEIQTTVLPAQIFSRLSGREKKDALSAQKTGKNLFCLEIDFQLAKFADGITDFRETLSKKCEIIATLPGRKTGAPGEIGFQILLATAENAEDIKRIADEHSAEIVFQKTAADFSTFSNDLSGVLAQIAVYGENLAARLGKAVDFEVSATDEKISPQRLKIVFDLLLHLVRNAIDHAVEPPDERAATNKPPRGLIRIQFSNLENGCRLTVADDGRGIDLEKIRAAAVEKNIVSNRDVLSDRDTLDLIFAPEFSTAERLTEISGRGVGLDAVKHSIEKSGGGITVESRVEIGTTFEIFLPAEK